MTQAEQQRAAKGFAEFWQGKGDEKQETQRYWIGLLQEVLGVQNAQKVIEFEKRVKLTHTSFIDAYIADTKVLIEQKGSKIDLTKPQEQSDGAVLTPYQQAKRYADELSYDLRPRWIVVSNFKEIHIHDMNKPHDEQEIIKLENLEKEYYRLQFLVDEKNENIRREEKISLEAGILVGKLYDALIKEYINPDEKSLRSLNILCVRLVFCFYAEDAGLFASRTSFEDYIKSFNLPNLRRAMIDLFKGLDTKPENRDKYDSTLAAFPYVNGGLFAAEDIEIPNFTQEIVDVLVNDCAPFDWREISPTIFGAVFESTLNPETRRSGGMHYTSVENIHKVIDPLFMNDLEAEFEAICQTKVTKTKIENLLAFQEKLGKLKFLDPACGSGNFLTETYLSLRRLENRVISVLNKGEKVLGFDEFIKVKINQFYGIEINDFAVTVAKTALWIAESQMMRETEMLMGVDLEFFPLTTNAFIVEGNALRMDWATLKPIDESEEINDGLFAGFDAKVDGNRIDYDYIIGNPPFVGYSLQSKEQKNDILCIYVDEKGKPYKTAGKIDYVAGWYFKAAQLMVGTNIRTAFVSTNSITQGEQVAGVWKPLYDRFGIHIDFAHRTFRWDSEASLKAHVHCVIVGFSVAENPADKRLFDNGIEKIVKNINAYLVESPDIFIESNKKPICNVPEMLKGSSPVDDGNFFFNDEQYNDIIRKEPQAQKHIRKFYGAREYLHNISRWCLWLDGVSPAELKKMPYVMSRISAVREFRLKSTKEATRKYADYPTRFMELRQPTTDYILIPRHTSENRKYIPFGFMSSDIICGDANNMLPNATLYHFGILTSNVHMAWIRTVCGRIKSDYRYSNDIVYNNFPWCNPTEEQKAKIEKTAQMILDARNLYPDCSLADLYDEVTMPVELRKAHQENDNAVMKAYGFVKAMTESEIVAELFKLYQQAVEK